MINRIAQLGPCLRHFRSQNAWPTPSEILAAGSDYLLNVARVGYRTDAILTLCRNARDGSFDPDSLDALAQTASTEELYTRLLSIKGIGPTSAGFLLSLLGRFDRMSVDSWTIAYVTENHMKGRKPTVRQVERIYERYGDWRQLVWWFEQWLTWDTARSMLDGKQK
jgi:3-methyladenine DNA glycosylase/8-oxoguanine DNA glycosylase